MCKNRFALSPDSPVATISQLLGLSMYAGMPHVRWVDFLKMLLKGKKNGCEGEDAQIKESKAW